MSLSMSRRAFARVAALSLAPGVALGASRDPVVQTSSGPVRGRVEDGVNVFKGVSYGAPTGGANRFKPAGVSAAAERPVFGESGGGRKTSTLMGMPDARGLFHRAIIQSGPGLHLQPRDKATAVAAAFLDALAIAPKDVAKLHELPVDIVLEAYAKVAGGFDDLSRMKGRFEQRGFVPTVGVQELPAYARKYPDASPAERWVLITSDRTYRFDSITLAQRKAELGPAVYMYYFTWESEADPALLSHHALEIPFAFDNVERSAWAGTRARALAAKMSSAWIAFARDGNPNTPALPQWPAYHSARRATMVLDNECRTLNDPDPEIRQLWATV